jgi:hypothetical protein
MRLGSPLEPEVHRLRRQGPDRRRRAQRRLAGVEIGGVASQDRLHRPALAGLRLQVGGQQHADAGAPGAEQGDGQVGGIFQVHRQALHAAGLQARRQLQGLPRSGRGQGGFR